MGLDRTPGLAFFKSQVAAGQRLPTKGTVFLSLAARDKAVGLQAAQRFAALGFEIVATAGTAALLRQHDVPVAEVVAKIGEPEGSDAVDLLASGRIDLVINSPRGRGSRADGDHIRAAAGQFGVPLLTTGAAGLAAANGIADWLDHPLRVRTLQEYHGRVREEGATS
jgi:carbamoyl-phosphate synthase large subunit